MTKQYFVVPVKVTLQDGKPVTLSQMRDYLLEAAVVDLDHESAGMAPPAAGEDATVSTAIEFGNLEYAATDSKTPIQERRGLYYEEVHKLVDGVESEIAEGLIDRRDAARVQLSEAAKASSWLAEPLLACEVLLHSQHAALPMLTGDHPPDQNFRLGDGFPFAHYAQQPLILDCLKELSQRDAYRRLGD